jgi:hypothetical protein
LPQVTKRSVTFLAPRLWKHSDLNLDEPAPVLGLGAQEELVRRPAPQWGAFLFDLEEPEPWRVEAAGERIATIHVPNMVDSLTLVRCNADPRWRAVAAQWKRDMSRAQTARVEQTLATLRRIPAPGSLVPVSLGPGPPVRRRLVTPPWFESLHRDALEVVARGLDA